MKFREIKPSWDITIFIVPAVVLNKWNFPDDWIATNGRYHHTLSFHNSSLRKFCEGSDRLGEHQSLALAYTLQLESRRLAITARAQITGAVCQSQPSADNYTRPEHTNTCTVITCAIGRLLPRPRSVQNHQTETLGSGERRVRGQAARTLIFNQGRGSKWKRMIQSFKWSLLEDWLSLAEANFSASLEPRVNDERAEDINI